MILTKGFDTPIECFLRAEFCFNQEEGHGTFYPGYLIGLTAIGGLIPMFQVLLANGAMWARVPLHMVCSTQCPPLAPNLLSWWDCFSERFTIAEFDNAGASTCFLKGRDGAIRQGRYVFTVDWLGGWANIADQHKQHHMIELDSGHFAMYPNNKIIWKDQSFYSAEPIPRWKVNTHTWSVEGGGTVIADTTERDYQVKEPT